MSPVADVIAMGVVTSVASNQGPVIPFRGGRVDASKAGVPGVPEPHGDLAAHTESFRKQGFTSTEMIELIAYVFLVCERTHIPNHRL
jgi:hypothetical protein